MKLMFFIPIISKFSKTKLIRFSQPCPFGLVNTYFKENISKFLIPNCKKKSLSISLQVILSINVMRFSNFCLSSNNSSLKSSKNTFE